MGAEEVSGIDKLAKLSLVGAGLKSHPEVAADMFSVLGKLGINIQLIATSEIKISVIIDEAMLEQGVRALHDAFRLNENVLDESRSAIKKVMIQ